MSKVFQLLLLVFCMIITGCSLENNKLKNTKLNSNKMSLSKNIINNLIFIICVLSTLSGCGNNEVKVKDKTTGVPWQEEGKEETGETDKLETHENLEILVDAGSISENSKADEGEKDFIDYSKYLKRIWILEEGEMVSDYRYSFVFTRIEEGIIEGKLATGANVSYYYFRQKDYEKNAITFDGNIYNGAAQCSFCNVEKGKGTITFQFYEDDRIEAKLDYLTFTDEEAKLDTEKSYTFRPYTIKDFNKLNQFIINDNENVSYVTNLDTWGEVKFVSGVNNFMHPYPVVFLTNEKDEILFQFKGLTNGFDVIDINVEDMNGDGLKDVTITLGDSKDMEVGCLIWIYYQVEDGRFYIDESDERRLELQEW